MTQTSANAARLHEPGKPLRIEAVPLSEPGEDEALVDLQFGAVNPIDRYIAEGQVAPDGPLPRTLGGEAAGMLDGQPVLVAGEQLGAARDGVWTQLAIVPRAAIVSLPRGVAVRDAAAMGIAGLTAWKVVDELGQVGPEDRVVVLGASGGVGSMIVTLARARGATVWGQTGSAAKSAPIRDDGAERVLIGGPDDIAPPLAEFEPTVVFDPLGDGFTPAAVEALGVGGRLVPFGVSAGAEVTLNFRVVYRKMISILGYGGTTLGRQERRAGLERALEALAAGDLRVRIDSVLPLSEVNEAFARLTRREVEGKLLLDLS